MNKLWSLYVDYGRYGRLAGLWIATDEEMSPIWDKDIYFGEILGKHSEVSAVMNDESLTILSDDQHFLLKLKNTLGNRRISGYCPLDYYEEEDVIC